MKILQVLIGKKLLLGISPPLSVHPRKMEKLLYYFTSRIVDLKALDCSRLRILKIKFLFNLV